MKYLLVTELSSLMFDGQSDKIELTFSHFSHFCCYSKDLNLYPNFAVLLYSGFNYCLCLINYCMDEVSVVCVSSIIMQLVEYLDILNLYQRSFILYTTCKKRKLNFAPQFLFQPHRKIYGTLY